MNAQHTPMPWHPATYKATSEFRAIDEHEALCGDYGLLLAVFGPKGDPRSIADRDIVARVVKSHEALLEAAKLALEYLSEINYEGAITPASFALTKEKLRNAITEAQP